MDDLTTLYDTYDIPCSFQNASGDEYGRTMNQTLAAHQWWMQV
jgi:hypothetical protein